MDPTTGGVPQGKLRLLKSRLKRKDSGRSKAQRPSPTNKQRTAASGARAIRQPGPDFHARRAANSAAGAAAGAGSGAGMGGVGAAGGSGRGAELARAVPHSGTVSLHHDTDMHTPSPCFPHLPLHRAPSARRAGGGSRGTSQWATTCQHQAGDQACGGMGLHRVQTRMHPRARGVPVYVVRRVPGSHAQPRDAIR